MKRFIHRRNLRYKNAIALADKRKILGVAIDTSSNFHRVVIFDFLGEIIDDPFSIDLLKGGYDLLVKNINKAQIQRSAINIYIAIESAGVYSQNLYIHICSEFKNVILISPAAVAENRKQKSLYGLKSDDIDCGSIGDLLIRGEFTKSSPDNLLYFKLRNLVYWREKKIDMLVILKNQIANRLERCFPGLNCDFNDNKKIYAERDCSMLYQGLINNCLTGQEILRISDEELCDKFNYKLTCRRRKDHINRLKSRIKTMLLPDEDAARIQLEILAVDVKLLRMIEKELKLVEQKIIELGRETPGIYIMGQIKGLSDLYASMYVGLIGNIRKYSSASKIYSFSGMSPKIHQSGSAPMTSARGIKKAGNVLLRSLLYKMAGLVQYHEPVFRDFIEKKKIENKRHWKKNRIALSRKLNNVLFALIRDKSQFKGKTAGNSIESIGN